MNVSYSVELGEPSGDEPCTLQECKDQLKIDFSTDDALITSLIAAARAEVEQFTGRSLVDREVQALIQLDGCFLFELPYGPVQSITSITALAIFGGTNEVVTDFDLYGDPGQFAQIKPKNCGTYTAVYEAGHTVLPGPLRQAVIHQVAYLYEHRGDESGIDGMSPTAKTLAKAYRRVVI